MRIFATGMNPADSNAFKRDPRVNFFQAFAEGIRYLQDLGHEVEWRRFMVGQPILPKTEAVIVSTMLPRSLNSPYALGVMWAISEALREDIPLVIYLTDWQFFNVAREFRSIAKEGTDYFFKKIGGAPQYAENPVALGDRAEALLQVCVDFANPSSVLWKNAQILCPLYARWGDRKIVQRLLPGANPVHGFDPTPLFLRYLDATGRRLIPPEMEKRARRWVLPSLLVDDRWVEDQNLRWRVDRFGPKRYRVLPDERAVHVEYAKRVGALCPPYPTVGSGWWRSRWIHAARTRTVLLCDPGDGRLFGAPYLHSGSSYESMTSETLAHIAEGQADLMELHMQREFGWMEAELLSVFQDAGA